MLSEELIWEPQPRQIDLITCPIEDVLFGGARGGGKSDGLLGDWATHAEDYGRYARGIFFRKSYPELEEIERRCHEIFPGFGAHWQATKRTWVWPNQASLRLRFLERDIEADSYQGHSYCVAVGTRIVMASGLLKRIESIQVGEYVQTLEGPQVVTATLAPYQAPCVLAVVFDASACVVGSQVHPWRHPVLTTAGVHGLPWARLPGSVQQFLDGRDVLYTQDARPRLDARQEIPAWCAYARDAQSTYTEPYGQRRGWRQLRPLCVPVALHAPTLQSRSLSWDFFPEGPTRYYSQDRWPVRSLDSYAMMPWEWTHQMPRPVHGQSIPQNVSPAYANDLPYAFYEKHRSQDSLNDYPSADGSYGARALPYLKNVQDDIQRVSGAARPSPVGSADGWGTIPTDSHRVQRTYTHPYTGEARGLSEDVTEGFAVLVPYGSALVTDLTVANANHYVTESGLVNKNTWQGWDELGNWASPLGVDKLRACLRSPQGVPCFFRGSANPGGVGHNWVKARYVDPASPMTPFTVTETIAGETVSVTRCFIPATLEDNPLLLRHDPQYWQRVMLAAGSNEALLKAWRYGLWDIVAGGMLDDIWHAAIHIVEPFDIPATWRIRRAFDWGSSKPFSVGWWAHSDGASPVGPAQRVYPKGTRFRLAEYYGWNGKPNEGLRMTNTDMARRIKAREDASPYRGRVLPGPADTQIYDVVNGRSIADEMATCGITWLPAQKGPGSRRQGWQLLRQLLKASRQWPMEEPGLFVFDTCRQFIRTVPVLPRDPTNADDVDSAAEDHVGDETRYECGTPVGSPMQTRRFVA